MRSQADVILRQRPDQIQHETPQCSADHIGRKAAEVLKSLSGKLGDFGRRGGPKKPIPSLCAEAKEHQSSSDACKGYCDDIRILPVPIDLLALLVALLSFHRQRSDWTGFQPLQRNRLASLLAITVGVVLDAL